jgi:hypothetical protein
MASVAKITAISKNDTVMGGIYINDNADAFKSQPSLLLVLVNTPSYIGLRRLYN